MRAIQWSLGKAATSFALALLCLGCGESSPTFQTVPMASPGRFAGQWFDREGHLIAEVSEGGRGRFSLRLDERFKLVDARTQDRRLLFRFLSEWRATTIVSVLSFVGENRGVINDLLPSEMKEACHICRNPCQGLLSGMALVRNPSRAWLARQSAKRTELFVKVLYKKTYDAVFDGLARIL
jgi:hypothetical protein